MRKLFISIPMRDKSDSTIKLLMADAKSIIEDRLCEEFELIDTLIQDKEPDDSMNGCWHLGQSISMLSKADLVAFAPGWENAPGCMVEYIVCLSYKIPRTFI